MQNEGTERNGFGNSLTRSVQRRHSGDIGCPNEID
jgi:hypothetical protein